MTESKKENLRNRHDYKNQSDDQRQRALNMLHERQSLSPVLVTASCRTVAIEYPT